MQCVQYKLLMEKKTKKMKMKKKDDNLRKWENEKESTDKDYTNVKETEDQIEVSEPNRRKSW